MESENQQNEKAVLGSNQNYRELGDRAWYRNIHVMETIRRWGLKFNGSKDARSFIKILTEYNENYRIQNHEVLRGLVLIFQGPALEWIRQNKSCLSTWEKFVKAFLEYFRPTQFLKELEDEIEKKSQGPTEKAADFIRSFKYLIYQHPCMKVNENIDRIYSCLRPEYHTYFWRNDFDTLEELQELAEEYEFIQTKRQHCDFNTLEKELERLLEENERKRNKQQSCNTVPIRTPEESNTAVFENIREPFPDQYDRRNRCLNPENPIITELCPPKNQIKVATQETLKSLNPELDQNIFSTRTLRHIEEPNKETFKTKLFNQPEIASTDSKGNQVDNKFPVPEGRIKKRKGSPPLKSEKLKPVSPKKLRKNVILKQHQKIITISVEKQTTARKTRKTPENHLKKLQRMTHRHYKYRRKLLLLLHASFF